ncbi:hypothetical protein JQM83_04150 [Parabacteroides distasonis]|nr:hypothetical protein [Parabacteroides distasonis]
MNKKFSTLVASLLLAGAVSVQAGVIDLSVPATSRSVSPVAAYDATANPNGGYQVGISYVLRNEATDEYLSIKDGKLALVNGNTVTGKLSDARKALWTLQQIVSPAGAVAPKYVFMNDATHQILAVDPSSARIIEDYTNASAVTVGGSQTEWLSAPSYTAPSVQPDAIYATLEGDSIVALAKNGNDVVLVKTKKNNIGDPTILHVKPYVFSGTGFYLSAKDLNTMLGAAGVDATADSYFSFNFNPTATVMGEDNLWTQDLQAVAVDQYEVKWETKADANGSVVRDAYASLYPLRLKKSSDAQTVKSITDTDPVFYKYETAQYLAFRNRDGKYLVVDTTAIDGTSQVENKRMSFAMDDLFNAKKATRFRNPQSYLYSVLYNPSTKNITIKTKGYYKTPGAAATIDYTPSTYYTSYDQQAMYKGSTWTSTATNEQAQTTIIKASLGATNEVTVGDVQTNPNNQFAIQLGISSKLQMTHLASGAYLIKVYASDNAERVGKYWVNNLKGGFEVMEQAVRQNFQDMPAAQWIVNSTGALDGSPITIVNREFEGKPTNVISSGVLYREATYPANVALFSVGQDVLQFIPVEKAADKYLGYKYVDDKEIDITTFTFNYLHDLAMDKPINTKSDKDSVVWVDKDGNATKFILEKYMDDTYGTNGGLTTVANLTRRLYKVKVNDASKLSNDQRYLAYDDAQKKYKVSDNGNIFFLKENNEVEGGECYYALVKAETSEAGTVPVVLNDKALVTGFKDGSVKVTSFGTYVSDNDIFGMFKITKGQVKNPQSGLMEDGKVLSLTDVRYDDLATAPFGSRYIPVTPDQYATINGAAPTGEYSSVPTSLTTHDITYAAWVKHTVRGVDYVVCAERYLTETKEYASSKVSVDNNTLDLVNGVLSNNSASEVATSAFAVTPVSDPLYRRFNVAELGENADDVPNTLKFFRVNATDKEYLYEDALSVYSKDKGFNFLGVEGKGDAKNSAIYVDTAYVDRNTKMPQYMLALRPNFVKGDTILCDATTHAHATPEEALACEHSKTTPSYVDAWYLVNLQDSIDYYSDPKHEDLTKGAKYQWNRQYTRLGFVEARHIGDTLVIKNSVYTGNKTPIKIGKPETWAGKDSIRLDNNLHKNVVFSFRIAKSGSNDFLIESETEKDGNYIKNANLEAAKIAPMRGGWVKIQNGVPVIANVTYAEIGTDAEIFNVEVTEDAPTANEAVEAAEVSVVATQGAIIVKGAAGKVVTVANILGQTIANQVAASDNVTIAAPAGVAVVTVDGEATKVVVK